MNTTSHTIAKNAGVLMVSQLLTWGLSLLLNIFLPRFLGVAAVGKFHLANSLWAIVAIIATFGMDTLLTKEIARAPTKLNTLFGTSILLRSLLYTLGGLGLAIYTRLAGYPTETVYVIVIVGVANLIVQFASACEATLRGLEKMEYISLSLIISKVVLTLVSIALLLLGQGVLVVASVSIGAALINLSILVHYLRRLQPLRLRVEWQLVGWMLRASAPYLAVYAFLVLYMQVDIVIISLLVSEEGVGWYGAADHLFGTLLFVPTVFITAVFPALARMYADASASLTLLMRKSFDLLLLLSIPIGLGVLVIANPLVVLLFGPAFANSGPVLAVMGIVLILTYQNMLLGQFLIATNQQSKWTWVMAAATAATIPLDLILVPWCQRTFANGAIGGALAFVVTEFGMLLIGLRFLPPNTLGRHNAWVALRVLLGGLAMVAVTWWVRHLFIAVPIALGALTFTLAILALRVIPAEDWALGRQIILSAVTRLRKGSPQPIS
jgi:O-antigen/teichoic acid export membrane protein